MKKYNHLYENEILEIIELRKSKEYENAFTKINSLIQKYPDDAVLYYHAAWICDTGRTEKEAVEYYLKSIQLGLSDEDLCNLYLALGSTYRSLGLYENAKEIFLKGINEFPNFRPYHVFLAMTEYNLKNSNKAVELLLTQLIETTNNKDILEYERAIRFYIPRLNDIFE
ncbi:tetratricopeptide repeat protein [Fluviispira multicolorata]|uniref:Tetratricopeptide repeat protein n=1 Tax=Fluviispira multicolorata TaxID=2654512 RepID=A0A833N856_9BACT|nr:tetratricopeptide repeat protein [Fluviispira multicolorata]KAB8033656.1 tetratricopeptide repeat protein [Fluviispira multicolorata]